MIEKHLNIEIKNLILSTRNNDLESLNILLNLFNNKFKKLASYDTYNFYSNYNDIISKFEEIIMTIPIEATHNNNSTIKYISSSLDNYIIKKYKDRKKEQLLCSQLKYTDISLSDNYNLIFSDLIKNFSERDKKILSFRYINDWTLKQISDKLNLSEQYISQRLKVLQKKLYIDIKN